MGPVAPHTRRLGPPVNTRGASTRLSRLQDERGATLALVVVMLTAILGMMALAVDVGMLFAARSEAQRAADAAALAGASAFIDISPLGVADSARGRAALYAMQNTVQGVSVRAGEVTVQVVTDSSKVRVWIRRPGIATWFARFLGINTAAVSARAAARAVDAPTTPCVKPFAPPDMWADVDDDLNGNHVWDSNEYWSYNPAVGDRYQPYPAPAGSTSTPTGYGSNYRDNKGDWGRQMILKLRDPALTPISGWFYLWDIPPGGSFETYISTCNSTDVRAGETYRLLSGNRVGPTLDGVTALVNQDPTAYWSDAEGRVVGSRFTKWMDSPRVVKVPLYDPSRFDPLGGRVQFGKFAWVFLEPVLGAESAVTGRYVTTVRTLQLVE